MTALITLSHGSRHPAARAGAQALTRAAAATLGVAGLGAHLEFTEPTLEEAAREVAGPAVVVPLLFTEAFHATHDVPAHLRAASRFAPLTLARGVGMGADLAAVLAERVLADAPAAAHAVLYPVGTSDAAQARGYEALAGGVEKRCSRPVSVVAATRGGEQALVNLARVRGDLHILPLFVTEGLLLDKAREAIPRIEAETGARVTCSGPLTTDLAGIVADRYRTTLEV
ncbi:sirohydrochlorin chelatase [Corynebacterium bouchesdurhonense]|uniref:sirohydrochlorin chelatase n=1 Tax=Corynebacterium bouchesdurhonense TaxID=1720192 RepID=UPI0008356C81|nr:CbiX/SirB N-terminal domain-containing protein [Corynebacterium bouchesdurhonense]